MPTQSDLSTPSLSAPSGQDSAHELFELLPGLEVDTVISDTREDISDVFTDFEVSAVSLHTGKMVTCHIESSNVPTDIRLKIGERMHPAIPMYKVTLPVSEKRQSVADFLGEEAILNCVLHPPVLITKNGKYEIARMS